MAERQVPQIPDRLFFRIGDVSQLAGVEAYVLRFWETEFPMLSPKKTSTGQRQYRRKDVETVLEIKRLLYDEGYTIAGARKAIRERNKQKKTQGGSKKKQSPLPFLKKAEAPSPNIEMVKEQLREILALLSRP